MINFFNKFIYLFIYFWQRWVFVAARGLQLRQAGATLRCGAQASYCGGFFCYGAQALGTWASVAVARRFSSCGAQAQLLRGIWDLPGPGLKPVSPALAGGFLTTVPPRKSLYEQFISTQPWDQNWMIQRRSLGKEQYFQ